MKKWKLGILGCVVLLLLFVCLIWTKGVIHRQHLISMGNNIASRIEIYKNKNGRFPTQLSDIGQPETESGPIYYDHNASGYILWFGEDLGESTVYDSQAKQWKSERPPWFHDNGR